MYVHILLVLVVSATLTLAAGDETKEDDFIAQVSQIITAEANKAGDSLVASWDKNEKTDQQSVDEVLNAAQAKVLEKVKPDMLSMIKISLGEATTTPESTDMYKVLLQIVNSYTTELTLGRARALSKNVKIKESLPIKGQDDNLSKSIASLYDGITNKNVTEEEKKELIGKSQKQIDTFIKTSIKADDKTKSKVATRSGMIFLKHQSEKQQKISSNVAHKLTIYLTTSMCSPPSTVVVNQMCLVCQPHCTHCLTGGRTSEGHGTIDVAEDQTFTGRKTSTKSNENGKTTIIFPIIKPGAPHTSTNTGTTSTGGRTTTTITRHEFDDSGVIGTGYPYNPIVRPPVMDGHTIIKGSTTIEHRRTSHGVGGGSVIHGISHGLGDDSHGKHVSITDVHGPVPYIGTGVVDVRGTYSGGPANLWSLRDKHGQFTFHDDHNGEFKVTGNGHDHVYGDVVYTPPITKCSLNLHDNGVHGHVDGGGYYTIHHTNKNSGSSSSTNNVKVTSVSGGSTHTRGEINKVFIGNRPEQVLTESVFGSHGNHGVQQGNVHQVHTSTWGSSVASGSGSHHISSFRNSGGGDLKSSYSFGVDDVRG